MKPPRRTSTGEDFGLDGCSRFLQRLWRLAVPGSDLVAAAEQRDGAPNTTDEVLARATHRLVADVTAAYDRWAYNVAVAHAMAYLNDVYRYVQGDAGVHAPTLDAAIGRLLEVLAPATPHITAELWARRHGGDHVHERPWPTADPSMLVEETVTMVVQVDGNGARPARGTRRRGRGDLHRGRTRLGEGVGIPGG
ncbi:MAG: class I tRNA ligase family protein [Microthrixaceae bacterium]|nr:class I tRNA ligase family protein [Microthrixaceae bacterium]